MQAKKDLLTDFKLFITDIASGDHEIIVAFCNMMKHHYTKRESCKLKLCSEM